MDPTTDPITLSPDLPRAVDEAYAKIADWPDERDEEANRLLEEAHKIDRARHARARELARAEPHDRCPETFSFLGYEFRIYVTETPIWTKVAAEVDLPFSQEVELDQPWMPSPVLRAGPRFGIVLCASPWSFDMRYRMVDGRANVDRLIREAKERVRMGMVQTFPFRAAQFLGELAPNEVITVRGRLHSVVRWAMKFRDQDVPLELERRGMVAEATFTREASAAEAQQAQEAHERTIANLLAENRRLATLLKCYRADAISELASAPRVTE